MSTRLLSSTSLRTSDNSDEIVNVQDGCVTDNTWKDNTSILRKQLKETKEEGEDSLWDSTVKPFITWNMVFYVSLTVFIFSIWWALLLMPYSKEFVDKNRQKIIVTFVLLTIAFVILVIRCFETKLPEDALYYKPYPLTRTLAKKYFSASCSSTYLTIVNNEANDEDDLKNKMQDNTRVLRPISIVLMLLTGTVIGVIVGFNIKYWNNNERKPIIKQYVSKKKQ